MDWYSLTLVSLLFYALQGVLLKSAALRGCDRNLTIFYYTLTVAILSIPLILINGIQPATALYIGLAAVLVNGIAYSIQAITRLEALKTIPASIVYPIIRLNNAVVAILIVVFLGETMTFLNWVGVGLSVVSIYLLCQGDT